MLEYEYYWCVSWALVIGMSMLLIVGDLGAWNPVWNSLAMWIMIRLRS